MNVSHLRLVINAKIKENKKKADDRNKKRREPKIVPLLPDEDKYRYTPKETDSCSDAETGESIHIANARWNAKEGRINLNTKTIMAMGTGQLDIKARSPHRRKKEAPHSNINNNDNNSFCSSSSSSLSLPAIGSASPKPHANAAHSHSQSHSQYQYQSIHSDASVGSTSSVRSLNSGGNGSSVASSSSIVAEKRRHPLISKFLEIGPLYKPFHGHWNSKSNAIEIEDAETLREEGVDFTDEWDDGAADTIHTNAVDGDSQSDNFVDFDGNHMFGVEEEKRPTTGTSTIISGVSRSPPGSRAGGSRGSSRGGGGASRGSPSRASVTRRPPKSHLSPNIAAHNRKHWNAVEEKNFDELFSIVSHMERNKTLTKERKSKEGMDEVKRTCRMLAKIKTRGMRELVQAVDDEHGKEIKRQAEVSEHANNAGKTKELLKSHRDQRNAAKQYITALQTDNEIIFMNKMFEAGLLW